MKRSDDGSSQGLDFLQLFPCLAEKTCASGILAGVEEVDVFLIFRGILDD